MATGPTGSRARSSTSLRHAATLALASCACAAIGASPTSAAPLVPQEAPAPAAGDAEEARAPTTPIELGQVDWQRDLDAALAQSKATGKPLAVLFQEVPG
ncbi:MAG: hypothetical protein JNL90_11415 [Planctomycetes bacterium]|nr:hypothetical protein [Planctomycetota bacterium]